MRNQSPLGEYQSVGDVSKIACHRQYQHISPANALFPPCICGAYHHPRRKAGGIVPCKHQMPRSVLTMRPGGDKWRPAEDIQCRHRGARDLPAISDRHIGRKRRNYALLAGRLLRAVDYVTNIKTIFPYQQRHSNRPVNTLSTC